MIPGVELKRLTRHSMGDRGYYFEEVIRVTDDFFTEGFGQWSRSKMQTGVIKAFHLHHKQTDFWFVESGLIKAVLCDLRNREVPNQPGNYFMNVNSFREFYLGDDQEPVVLKIPPGVAHGLKVLQGPAVLSYITSRVYDPEDEVRIDYDSLGYDWDKRDIR